MCDLGGPGGVLWGRGRNISLSLIADDCGQLTEGLRADTAAMLTSHADKLTDALKANATRHEWSEAKTLMRSGGRPPRCGTERPYLEDEHGNPIPDHEH